MIVDMALGFIGGVIFMLVLSALDATLANRIAKRRFDDAVDDVIRRNTKGT